MQEAKHLRSVVDRPYRTLAQWDQSLTAYYDDGEREIDVDSVAARGSLSGEEATLEAAVIAQSEASQISGRLEDLHDMLDRAAGRLSDPRERHIFRARFLTDPRTKLKHLACEYGVSEVRIHQLGERAKNKVIATIGGARATLTEEGFAMAEQLSPAKPLAKAAD